MVKEWTIFDRQINEMTLHKCETQKQAIVTGLERGVVPRRSSDARPRSGDDDLMTREKFDEFMEKVTK